MGLFGRRGSISNFFRKASGGARRAYTKSKGLINRVTTKVDKVLSDKTLNTINDVAGKVINSPLVEAGLIASGQPELLVPFELGKSAYNLGNTTFQTTKNANKTIKDVTVDRERQRREAREAEPVAPSIQRAKKRVVSDTQAIQFL